MRPRVALLPWGDVFEDWLEPLGVTPDQFREEVTGSWMFGYVDSLRVVGVDTVLVCFTSRVAEPARWVHRPTGATLHLIPLGPAFSCGVAPYAPRAHRRQAHAEQGRPRRPTQSRSLPCDAGEHSHAAGPCGGLRGDPVPGVRDAPLRLGVVAGALTRLPVFASFQGGDYHVSRIEGAARRFTIGRADRLIVPTASEVERLRRRYGLADGKVERIFNPIDVDVWRPRAARWAARGWASQTTSCSSCGTASCNYFVRGSICCWTHGSSSSAGDRGVRSGCCSSERVRTRQSYTGA